MRIAYFIYGILKALKTLIWHGVLYLFYIACPNTILLSFLYIAHFVKLDVTPNGSLEVRAWLCRKTRHPP